MHSFIFALIVFFYVFGPVLRPLGNVFDMIFFTSLILISYNFFKGRKIFPQYIFYFLPLILLYTYIAFLVSFLPDANLSILLSLLLKPIRIIVTIAGGYSLLVIFLKDNPVGFSLDVCWYVFFAIFLHAIIMLVQFINPAFKDFIYSFTTVGEFRSSFEYNFRMGGLSGGSGGAILSVVQSLGIILVPFLWNDSNIIKKAFLIKASIAIFLSVLICGRSGLWNLILCLPLSIIWFNGLFKLKTLQKLVLLVIGLMIFFPVGINYFLSNIDEGSDVYYSFGRTMDVLISFYETGLYSNPTISTLKSHILFPESVKTFILGDGEHSLGKQFDRTLDSDIGYIKNLWSFGIFGLITYLTPIILLLVSSLKSIAKIDISRLLTFLIFIMLVFHAKESFLYVRMFLSIISLFAASYYLELSISRKILPK